jgi:hypothetical protein
MWVSRQELAPNIGTLRPRRYVGEIRAMRNDPVGGAGAGWLLTGPRVIRRRSGPPGFGPPRAMIRDVRVDHRGPSVVVAEELPDRPEQDGSGPGGLLRRSTLARAALALLKTPPRPPLDRHQHTWGLTLPKGVKMEMRDHTAKSNTWPRQRVGPSGVRCI